MDLLARIDQMRPAIKKCAAKYAVISRIDVEDLEQEAAIALIELNYDPACGYRWVTVALRAIDWYLLKRIKEIGPLIAVPRYFQERGGEVPRPCLGDASEVFNALEDGRLSALERMEAIEEFRTESRP